MIQQELTQVCVGCKITSDLYCPVVTTGLNKQMVTRRFRNFSFYPSIAPTGLVRADDSLETETRFKEERRK